MSQGASGDVLELVKSDANRNAVKRALPKLSEEVVARCIGRAARWGAADNVSLLLSWVDGDFPFARRVMFPLAGSKACDDTCAKKVWGVLIADERIGNKEWKRRFKGLSLLDVMAFTGKVKSARLVYKTHPEIGVDKQLMVAAYESEKTEDSRVYRWAVRTLRRAKQQRARVVNLRSMGHKPGAPLDVDPDKIVETLWEESDPQKLADLIQRTRNILQNEMPTVDASVWSLDRSVAPTSTLQSENQNGGKDAKAEGASWLGARAIRAVGDAFGKVKDAVASGAKKLHAGAKKLHDAAVEKFPWLEKVTAVMTKLASISWDLLLEFLSVMVQVLAKAARLGMGVLAYMIAHPSVGVSVTVAAVVAFIPGASAASGWLSDLIVRLFSPSVQFMLRALGYIVLGAFKIICSVPRGARIPINLFASVAGSIKFASDTGRKYQAMLDGVLSFFALDAIQNYLCGFAAGFSFGDIFKGIFDSLSKAWGYPVEVPVELLQPTSAAVPTEAEVKAAAEAGCDVVLSKNVAAAVGGAGRWLLGSSAASGPVVNTNNVEQFVEQFVAPSSTVGCPNPGYGGVYFQNFHPDGDVGGVAASVFAPPQPGCPNEGYANAWTPQRPLEVNLFSPATTPTASAPVFRKESDGYDPLGVAVSVMAAVALAGAGAAGFAGLITAAGGGAAGGAAGAACIPLATGATTGASGVAAAAANIPLVVGAPVVTAAKMSALVQGATAAVTAALNAPLVQDLGVGALEGLQNLVGATA